VNYPQNRFAPSLVGIKGDHIVVDVNTVVSLATVNVVSREIDLTRTVFNPNRYLSLFSFLYGKTLSKTEAPSWRSHVHHSHRMTYRTIVLLFGHYQPLTMATEKR